MKIKQLASVVEKVKFHGNRGCLTVKFKECRRRSIMELFQELARVCMKGGMKEINMVSVSYEKIDLSAEMPICFRNAIRSHHDQ